MRLCFLLLFTAQIVFAQHKTNLYSRANQAEMNKWVDSVFSTMTPDERIGQLFMLTIDPAEKYQEQTLKWIKNQKVGGILFAKGTLTDHAKSTNVYQAASQIPLFISFDGEWGLAMRLPNTPRFPRNMAVGAIEDNELIRLYGEEVGREMNELGVHMNFAPVLDVNVNPSNPVIGNRAFGEHAQLVAEKGNAYSAGLENKKVIAVAKHFPGHGDTQGDSHKTLPLVRHDKQRMKEVDLHPFEEFIKNGYSGIMTGHLYVPAYDKTAGMASSLSPKIVDDLLQKEMGFTGLVITDALVMEGALGTKKAPALLALLANNDILLKPGDIVVNVKVIKDAVAAGTVSMETIDAKCRKILSYKYITGLNKYKPIEMEGLSERINTEYANNLVERVNREAITLLKNNDDAIPFTNLEQKIAVLSIGERDTSQFQKHLATHGNFAHFYLPEKADLKRIQDVFRALQKYDMVICGIHSNQRNYTGELQALALKVKTHLVFFISPYSISKYSQSIARAQTVTLAYETGPASQKAAAQIIMGEFPAKGRLPVTLPSFKYGSGIQTSAIRKDSL
ncbi:MAG: glycoside hydrolase family 3 protein [Fibromonadales bacterium]|nr:glycoside hydrolase family 3 protein [Fibromonadales bacterium]